MCGPFSMPQASSVLPENSEAMGGRSGTDEKNSERAWIWSSSLATHQHQVISTLPSSPAPRSWPPLLHCCAAHFCLSFCGTMMGQVWSPVSLWGRGWGDLKSRRMWCLLRPCSLYTAKKCLWMTTAPFSPQISRQRSNSSNSHSIRHYQYTPTTIMLPTQ